MLCRLAGSAFLILTVLNAVAQQPLRSGPQPGDDIPGSFYPLNINGEDAGQKRCLV
jgi:hypothetical protein